MYSDVDRKNLLSVYTWSYLAMSMKARHVRKLLSFLRLSNTIAKIDWGMSMTDWLNPPLAPPLVRV